MRIGPSVAALLAPLLAIACKGPPQRQTPAEWLAENTTILAQLVSYEKKEQHEGINRILSLGKERGIAVVNYLLEDEGLQRMKDYRLEVVLARILADWKDTRAIPTLLRNLEGTDSGALAIVREGLITFGDNPMILDSMKEHLQDADTELRRTCVEVLSEMKGPEAVKLLSEHRRIEEDATIRGLCVLGILSCRDPRRTSFLVDCLEDADPAIRREAWLGVVRRSPPVNFDPRGDLVSRARSIAALKTWVKAGAPPAAPGAPATAEATPPTNKP
jgi:HEAT repeat protein